MRSNAHCAASTLRNASRTRTLRIRNWRAHGVRARANCAALVPVRPCVCMCICVPARACLRQFVCLRLRVPAFL
eukprot:11228334-Lingulodinium_polyedra.AAC.1